MRGSVILIAACLAAFGARGEKKALGHDSFDDWKSVVNHTLSRKGDWAVYSVNPQQGDGKLIFRNTSTGKEIVIPRGYKPTVTADSRRAVALIKPEYARTRQAKIDRKKDYEMPTDSLAIIDLTTGTVEKIPSVTDYNIGKEACEWMAYRSADTSYIAPKYLKEKEAGRPLVVRNMMNGSRKVTKWVNHYSFNEKGTRLALSVRKPEKDSLATNGIGVMFLPDTSYVLIDRDKAYYSAPVLDRDGNKVAYTASEDTVKTGTRRGTVYYADLNAPMHTPKGYALEFRDKEGNPLVPNQYTEARFSWSGERLIAGVAPVIAPNDTSLHDFETPALDIWRWDAPYTPPQENHELENTRKRNYPVCIDLSKGTTILVDQSPYAEVKSPDRWDGPAALVTEGVANMISRQWDYYAEVEMALVNLTTGERRVIGTCPMEEGALSPEGKYVYWYADRQYHIYDIAEGKTRTVTEGLPYGIWDTDDDYPAPAPSYGVAGWTRGDNRFLIYDRYDIWAIDPKGKEQPVCITAGAGRKNGYRYRYVNTDPDRRAIGKGDEILLSVFDTATKYNGLVTYKYTGSPVAPAADMMSGHSYTQIRKAKDADVYSWQRANFSESPDIWIIRGTHLENAVEVTDANPQMKEYRWGTARLVKWTAYDGKESEGVLYVPDDIDPEKKYPMLCVFYERNSENLYRHYTMEPSWSWVNYPFYVSRGYVVFVPDIHYTAGIPGESCYNYVCSGAEEMCRRYPWIDRERIGIDGQSWGGYQTAYLVTQTDMFACAGSGAPVANMTSAFGGIRWESGDSRQAQYEMGQSRIGRNLWDSPELYIANSPVFHADRVKTPLLIMHNDADGAVPWYQGIEMFMALRRLGKPVWMLQYNGEAHNIRARKNRKDITIRLQQFFDHYLKGDAMPAWMKDGIPAIRKGQEFGY